MKSSSCNSAKEKNPSRVPDLEYFKMPDGLGIQFRGGTATLLIKGIQTETVIPWLWDKLDGKNSLHDLCSQAPADIRPVDIEEALGLLSKHGLILDENCEQEEQASGDSVLRRQRLFWGRKLGITKFHNSVGVLEESIKKTKLFLIFNGLIGLSTLDLLERTGFQSIEPIGFKSDLDLLEGRSGNIRLVDKKLDSLSEILEEQAHAHDLLITVMRNGTESIYRQINRFVLKTGITWLRVEDAPDAIEVGPLVNPGDSGCHECMILRKRSSDEYAIEEQLYQSHLDMEFDDKATLHGESLPTATLAASLAVTEIFNFASKVNPTTMEDTVSRVFFDGKIERHKFSRVPRCPECYQGEVLTVYQSGNRE